MTVRRRRGAAALVACLALAACGADEATDEAPDEASGEGSPTGSPTATTTTQSAGPDGTGSPTVVLEVPTRSAGRCGRPDASVLSRADYAFDGTVGEVEDSDATLTVARWYTESEEDVVLVTARPGAPRTAIFPELRPGERYLVAAVGTELMACGYTDRWQPELEELYAEAFAQPE